MGIARDTSSESDAAQVAALRGMGSRRRLITGMEMSDTTREIVVAGVRQRIPDASPNEVDREVIRILLGDALFYEVWPEEDAPLR
jgi:hypothetical protein